VQRAIDDAQHKELQKELTAAQKSLTATTTQLTSSNGKLATANARVSALESSLAVATQQCTALTEGRAAAVAAAESMKIEVRALRKQLTHSCTELAAVKSAHTAELQTAAAVHAEALTAATAATTAAAAAATTAAQQQSTGVLPTCAVCLDAAVQVMLQPCKHLILCSACAALEDMLLCPVCRAVITDMDTVHM
jgi:chromosome segregation ATPase